jgi:hypothetical protein
MLDARKQVPHPGTLTARDNEPNGTLMVMPTSEPLQQSALRATTPYVCLWRTTVWLLGRSQFIMGDASHAPIIKRLHPLNESCAVYTFGAWPITSNCTSF